MPGSFRQRSGRFSDLRARLRLRYGNDGCDGFSPNFPLILFAEPDCLFDCDNIISSTGFPVKCFFRKSVPVSVLLSDASPNSNNPNFVIIGDAFGFSVYFDYDRYERR